MIAQTFAGMEDVLARELLKLGASNIKTERRAVSFFGDKGFLYKANFCCRTAMRILKPIANFKCPNEDALYEGIKAINWLDLMEVDDTFVIDAICFNSTINHSHFASLKAKDAIADKFREAKNARPSIDKANPNLKVFIHISNNYCNVSLDSSGEQLFKRAYRIKTNAAPINEILAAGMVLMSGWDLRSNFIDPMCGSGTIPIEAALYAGNIPAGYYRNGFGFQKWKDFDENLWDKIVESSLNKIVEFEHEIIASDISSAAIDITNINLKNAKLHKDVLVMKKAFEELEPSNGRATIIMNPPYDERLKLQDSISFYKMIGDTLKNKYREQNVWVLTADNEAAKYIGLRAEKKIKLFNGSIDCNFVKYDMSF
ncbi:MAG: THUMP domain-containing protein [Bacteroidota bacterium]